MRPESKKSHYDPGYISDWNEWTDMRKRTSWMRRFWSKLIRKTSRKMIEEGLKDLHEEEKDIK